MEQSISAPEDTQTNITLTDYKKDLSDIRQLVRGTEHPNKVVSTSYRGKFGKWIVGKGWKGIWDASTQQIVLAFNPDKKYVRVNADSPYLNGLMGMTDYTVVPSETVRDCGNTDRIDYNTYIIWWALPIAEAINSNNTPHTVEIDLGPRERLRNDMISQIVGRVNGISRTKILLANIDARKRYSTVELPRRS
jgi:hypothetical protein